VLKGEAMGTMDLLVPAAGCVLLTLACLLYLGRQIGRAAVR
jgi:hypothetical protein